MAIQDYIKVYRDKGRDSWAKLNGKQKVIFSLLGVGVVVLFAVMILAFGSGSGGLTELKIPVSDPHAAVRRLAVYGITAEHNLEKAAVVVPKEMEQKAAMILTFTGLLPNGREAYGFLDESNLAMTDQRTRMKYIAMLQEMLGQTIAASPDISQAEVFLTEHGKPWEFRIEDKKLNAKASVKVETTHGGRLTEEQQLSIASLVAGSFQALTESEVRISDFQLNYYPTIDESWQMNFTVQSRQRQLQRDSERKIEFQLASLRAKAAVTIPMLIAERRDEYEEFDGEKRPTTTVTESYSNNSKTKYGTSGQEMDAGRDAVFDPGRAIADTSETKDIKREDAKYSSKRGYTFTKQPEPNYKEATAAVTVVNEGPLAPEKLSDIKNIAAGATGIPVGSIQVMVEAPDAMAAAGLVGGSADSGFAAFLQSENAMKIVLLMIALGSVVALMVMLRKSAPKPLTMMDETLEAEAEEDIPEIPGLPPVDQLHGNLVREKVVELVRKNPKAAANLVKRWMIFGK